MPGRKKNPGRTRSDAVKAPEPPTELVSPQDAGEETWLGALGAQTPRERVLFIADMMVSDQWDKLAARQLSDEWGITVTRVHQLASNASLYLDCAVNDREKLIKANLLRLAVIRDENGPDRTKAIDIANKVAGAYTHSAKPPAEQRELQERIVRDLSDPSQQLKDFLRQAWQQASPEVLKFYQTLGGQA